MSVSSGPFIVNNGLVFNYDMNNTGRSWLGKPTTNTNNGFASLGNGLTVTYVGQDNQGYSIYSLSGTWNSGTYPYSMVITSSSNFLGSTSYSAQCQIYNTCPQKWGAWGGINYVNDPNMISSGTSTVTTVSNYQIWKRENFIYSPGYAGGGGTSQFGYLITQPISNGTIFNPSTDFVYVKNIQIEQNTFCTPYTPFSRSNTQALLDLTGTNTVTTTSLTYASDNTFSYNGTSDYIECGNLSSSLGSNITVSTFARVSSIVSKNTLLSLNGAYNFFLPGNRLTTTYQLYWDSASGWKNGNTTTWNVNQWYNLTWTISGTTLTFYVNGIADGTTSIAANVVPSGASRIGFANAGEYATGSIGAVQVYNRALSAAEVAQNFNAQRSLYGI